jgi:hypothetical protein
MLWLVKETDVDIRVGRWSARHFLRISEGACSGPCQGSGDMVVSIMHRPRPLSTGNRRQRQCLATNCKFPVWPVWFLKQWIGAARQKCWNRRQARSSGHFLRLVGPLGRIVFHNMGFFPSASVMTTAALRCWSALCACFSNRAVCASCVLRPALSQTFTGRLPVGQQLRARRSSYCQT